MFRLSDLMNKFYPGFVVGPIIIADEVQERINNEDGWPAEAEADFFGCVAPPFEAFFVEAAGATLFQDQEYIITRGLEMQVLSMYGNSPDNLTADARHVLTSVSVKDPSLRHLHNRAKWVIFYEGCCQIPETPENNGAIYTFESVYGLLHIAEDGSLLNDMKRLPFFSKQNPGRVGSKSELLEAEWLASCVPFAMGAISAMHKRQRIELVSPTRQMRRFAKRKHQIELNDHYVLRVSSNKSFSSSRARSGVLRKPKREHTVRGHFRWTGDGLFGKGYQANQMIWIPDHERGSGPGHIDKDYYIDIT